MAPGIILLVLLTLFTSGCAGYRVQGTVVEGRTSSVLLVDKNDPRLAQDGLSDAIVQVTIDSNHLNSKTLAPTPTDKHGHFEVPVGEFGAGLLEYQCLVLTRLKGYQSTEHEMPLPPSDQRLLIIMAPGADTYQPREDIMRDTLRMKDEFESK